MFDFTTNMMPFLYGSMSTLGVFLLTWVISTLIKNLGIVDIVWGFGFTVQALVYYLTSNFSGVNLNNYRAGFVALVSLQGLRLAIYILIRAIGKPEDKRYKVIFREKYGENVWWISLFIIFLFQCILNLIIGFGIFTFACSIRNDIVPSVYGIGMGIMFIGFLFETIADLQLFVFKRDDRNKGKVLNTGLWYYSRHPNYFGEVVFWWGLYIVDTSATEYFTVFCPIIMTIFILYVSGITITEKFMTESRSDEYKEYILSTSSFIPWCKKNITPEIPVNVHQC